MSREIECISCERNLTVVTPVVIICGDCHVRRIDNEKVITKLPDSNHSQESLNDTLKKLFMGTDHISKL